jgi:FkbM family methyltransferase
MMTKLVNYWLRRNGPKTHPESDDAMELVDYVAALYRLVLRREPDDTGLNNYVNAVRTSGDYTLVLQGMLDSPEYRESNSSPLTSMSVTERPTSRTINLGDRELIVVGNPADPYFFHLNIGDHTNDFLLYVSRHFLRENATIFDIGANIGMTAVILATAVRRGQVYAFEPGADTYPYLLATIEANRVPNCHAQQIALGATSGEADFFSNPTSESASHLALDGVSLGGPNTRVKVKTVDDVVSELNLSQLDLIKIDVEGFELDVLEGAHSTIARLRPDILLEFNVFTLIAFGNKNPRSVLEQLRSTFPYVYRFEAGALSEIADQSSMLGFIHDNLTKHAGVDDLLCSFQPRS